MERGREERATVGSRRDGEREREREREREKGRNLVGIRKQERREE